MSDSDISMRSPPSSDTDLDHDHDINGSAYKRPFRFLDLPFNVRKMIYKLHFPDLTVPAGFRNLSNLRYDETLCSIALLLTCSGIYAEAIAVLYGSVEFCIRYNNASCLFYFLDQVWTEDEIEAMVGRRIGLIKKLTLEVVLGEDLVTGEAKREGLRVLWKFPHVMNMKEGHVLESLRINIFPMETKRRLRETAQPCLDFTEMVLVLLTDFGHVEKVQIKVLRRVPWMVPFDAEVDWQGLTEKYEELVKDIKEAFVKPFVTPLWDWLDRNDRTVGGYRVAWNAEGYNEPAIGGPETEMIRYDDD